MLSTIYNVINFLGAIAHPPISVCTFLDADSGKYMTSDDVPKIQVHCALAPLSGAKHESVDQWDKATAYKPKEVKFLISHNSYN